MLHVRGAVFDALLESKQSKVRQLDHPTRVYEAVGRAQRAVEANGRLVQVDDALRKSECWGQIRTQESAGGDAISIMLHSSTHAYNVRHHGGNEHVVQFDVLVLQYILKI